MIVMLLVATACSIANHELSDTASPSPSSFSDTGNSADSSDSSDATEPEAAERQDELIIGVPSDAGPLNMYTTSVDFMTNLVFGKLFGPSPDVDDPAPMLAEPAEQIDDVTNQAPESEPKDIGRAHDKGFAASRALKQSTPPAATCENVGAPAR